MEFAVEMASGGMIHIAGFMMIGTRVQKLLGGCTHRHTHAAR
jgi:hypothetical protein